MVSNFEELIERDVEDEDWLPTEAGRLLDCLAIAESATRETHRAAAAQLASIGEAVRQGLVAADVYIEPLFVGTREGTDLVRRAVATDLGMRLGISRLAILGLSHQYELLSTDLPLVWAACRAGRVSAQSARIVVDIASGLARTAKAEFDAEVLEPCIGLTPGKLRIEAEVIRDRLESESRQDSHDARRQRRHVSVEPDLHGMAWLHLLAPAATIFAAHAHLSKQAARFAAEPDETRGIHQIEADVAGDLLMGVGIGSTVTYDVAVTIPALALVRGDDAELPMDAAAMLEGYGPIDDETARRLFAKAPSFRRILTDPVHGVKLIMDRETYRPTATQRAWIERKYVTCAEPGCSRSARRCDIDHTHDWGRDGLTNEDNLAPLCRSIHTLKHKTRFSVVRNRSGTVTVRTPTGFDKDTDPPPF